MPPHRYTAPLFVLLSVCWVISAYLMGRCWLTQQWWITSAYHLYDLPRQREWFWRVVQLGTYFMPVAWIVSSLSAGAEFAGRRRIGLLLLLALAPFIVVLAFIGFRIGLFWLVTRGLK